MKTWLIVGLLAAVIFAVTVIATLSPKQEPAKGGAKEEADGDLAIGFADYLYRPDEPDPENWHYRNFNGFFETGTDGNSVGFVMRNFRQAPSFFRALRPSCPKCTGARVGGLPAKALDEYLLTAGLGSAFTAPCTFNLPAALAWTAALNEVKWNAFDFEDPRNAQPIPPAEGKDPAWLVVELDFRISGRHPTQVVAAYFDLLDAKKEKLRPTPIALRVSYAARPPFEIWPETIDAGDLPERCEPRTYDVFVFSMTRDGPRLPAVSAVAAVPNGALSIAEPVPLAPEECRQLAIVLSRDAKAEVIVRSAYRYAVTVRRESPGETAEVGPFRRSIVFAKPEVSSSLSIELPVNGRVVGPIRLQEGKTLDVGLFEVGAAFKKQFRFLGDNPADEIELVPERCEPKFVKPAFSPGRVEFGKKVWTLTLTIPENEGRQGPWSGTIVFRTKGDKPVTYRVPLSGRGQ